MEAAPVFSPAELIAQAEADYDRLRLDELPRALQRNSLDYYYLSIYPSLKQLRPVDEADPPVYPEPITNVYVHIPFCSGVCEFCSYFLVAVSPKKQAVIAAYLEQVRRELQYHARRARLDVGYLYFGGGTPSLMPAAALDRLLTFLGDGGYLRPDLMGTVELHPELFNDPAAAGAFLDTLLRHNIRRVSIGYQVSDEHLLEATKRRHATAFMEAAVSLLRRKGFLFNVDLMYGLPDQSLLSWATTLQDALRYQPDSISTYFLFVDAGTITHRRVGRGEIVLPTHRHVQTQHLMAQRFLEAAGYHELPNDFYARVAGDPARFRPERLPSAAHTLPVGPGAYGYYGGAQLCNVFDLDEYARRMAGGRSPLWRAYRLDAGESFCRDLMFALKNDPFVDCNLFVRHYNRSPLDVFADTLAHLRDYDLAQIEGETIRLTAKGRLCVEEIAGLFRYPGIEDAPEPDAAVRATLDKHNFAPTYPVVQWR